MVIGICRNRPVCKNFVLPHGLADDIAKSLAYHMERHDEGIADQPRVWRGVTLDYIVCPRCLKNPPVCGVHKDDGKLMIELISPIFIEGLAGPLTFGAKKYAPNNWRKGIAISRLWGSLMRHLWSFWRGEDLDPESGLSHLDHAACDLMFIRELIVTRPDLDDRYKPPGKAGQNQEKQQ